MNKIVHSKESDQILDKSFNLPRVKAIICGESLINFLIRLILLLINIAKILFAVTT